MANNTLYPARQALMPKAMARWVLTVCKVLHNDKTHLSISIAIKALIKGCKVLFTPVAEMLHNLNAAKADNTYYQKVDYYLRPDLLILDELGFKKLPGYSSDDFFEIISKRYKKGSLIITTNKFFE